MKKTSGLKKEQNALTNFKVFYQNVKGLKSKVDSIMETISEYQPMLICSVKTHLQKEEEIRIAGNSQKKSYIRGCSGKGNWTKLVDIS